MPERIHDLLVVGAGPTGIALGAEARKAGLDVLLLDRGVLTQALLDFPTYMTFFTTRELLEIADIPMSVPDDKPTRQQALAYYRAVAAHYKLPLALHEELVEARQDGEIFVARTIKEGRALERRARAVALATGYFHRPKKLDLPGAGHPWVHSYYKDPYRHFGERVVIVGAGNSGCEAALEMWRNGVHVTLVHQQAEVKQGVKYWVKPDIENRIAEGFITACFQCQPTAFHDRPRAVEIRDLRSGKKSQLPCEAAYVLIGFEPDAELERRCGIRVDPETLVPEFDPESCESNIPGLYIAGTIQAGRDTNSIFIENSRAHAPKIVNHLKRRRRTQEAARGQGSKPCSTPAR